MSYVLIHAVAQLERRSASGSHRYVRHAMPVFQEYMRIHVQRATFRCFVSTSSYISPCRLGTLAKARSLPLLEHLAEPDGMSLRACYPQASAYSCLAEGMHTFVDNMIIKQLCGPDVIQENPNLLTGLRPFMPLSLPHFILQAEVV